MENQEKPSEKAQTDEAAKKMRAVQFLMFDAVVEFAFYIGIPLYVFARIGKWLDAKYHHNNIFTLAGVLLALALSIYIIYTRTKQLKNKLK